MHFYNKRGEESMVKSGLNEIPLILPCMVSDYLIFFPGSSIPIELEYLKEFDEKIDKNPYVVMLHRKGSSSSIYPVGVLSRITKKERKKSKNGIISKFYLKGIKRVKIISHQTIKIVPGKIIEVEWEPLRQEEGGGLNPQKEKGLINRIAKRLFYISELIEDLLPDISRTIKSTLQELSQKNPQNINVFLDSTSFLVNFLNLITINNEDNDNNFSFNIWGCLYSTLEETNTEKRAELLEMLLAGMANGLFIGLFLVSEFYGLEPEPDEEGELDRIYKRVKRNLPPDLDEKIEKALKELNDDDTGIF